MVINDFFTEEEAQSGSFGGAGGFITDTIEFFEDPAFFLFGDPFPPIAYAEFSIFSRT
jgi:hypothetical protein